MQIFFLIFVFLLNSSVISKPLVNSTWVSKNLCKENVKLIEIGSSYNSYLVEHIKCSQYTNFYKDGWRINDSEVAMQLPKYNNLVSVLKKMGIKNEDHVILYPKKISDYYAMSETTAIYFTFKLLGHEKISILDGGYPDFKKNFDLLTEEGEFKLEPVNEFKININNTILANIDDISKKNFQIVDAREKDFYLGINKLKGFKEFGTIKGALNIPSKWFLKDRGFYFNDKKVLKDIYDFSEVNREKSTIFFCYSGLESSINWFVFHELMKKKNSRLFEGSIFNWVAQGKLLHKKF